MKPIRALRIFALSVAALASTVFGQGFSDTSTLTITPSIGGAAMEVRLAGRVSTAAPTQSLSIETVIGAHELRIVDGGPLCAIVSGVARDASTKPPLSSVAQQLQGPVFDVALANCNGSSDITLELRVPSTVSAGAATLLLNRSGTNPAWRVSDTTSADPRVLRFVVAEGGVNDLDGLADGAVSFTVGVSSPTRFAAVTAVPTISPGFLLGLVGLLAVIGAVAARRQVRYRLLPSLLAATGALSLLAGISLETPSLKGQVWPCGRPICFSNPARRV
jgi:hypothetical protein